MRSAPVSVWDAKNGPIGPSFRCRSSLTVRPLLSGCEQKACAPIGRGKGRAMEKMRVGSRSASATLFAFAFAFAFALAFVPTLALAAQESGTDYTVAFKANTNVGTATLTVTGKGKYKGSASKTFAITKAKNTVASSKASVKKDFEAKALKKKAQTVALPKVAAKFGKATWSVKAKDKKKVLSLKGGKVRVKKGAKPGTYTMKLVASVKGTANYGGAATKAITVKVTVKK